MINLFRAEVYRVVHTKTYWFTQLAIVCFTLSRCYTTFNIPTHGRILTGAIKILRGLDGYSLFYMFPIVAIILLSDRKPGTLKNSITSGISWLHYFITKFLTLAVFIFIQLVFNYAVYFAYGCFIGGVGNFTLNLLSLLWYQWLAQCLMLMAVAAFTLLIFELTKSSILSIAAGFGTEWIIDSYSSEIKILQHFDFWTWLGHLVNTSFLHPGAAAQDLLMATMMIVIFGFTSFCIFHRLDL